MQASELKQQVGPIVARLSNAILIRNSRLVLFQPIGYYARGIFFRSSRWGDGVSPHLFVCPLLLDDYDIASNADTSFNTLCWVPGGGSWNKNWSLPDAAFLTAFDALMHEVLAPAIGRLRTGADCKHFFWGSLWREWTGRWGDETGPPVSRNMPHIAGAAELHSGNLVAAKAEFETYVAFLQETIEHWRRYHSENRVYISRLEQELQAHRTLIDLIDHRPADIPAHCQAVAAKNIERMKLTKWWKPEPFVFDNQR